MKKTAIGILLLILVFGVCSWWSLGRSVNLPVESIDVEIPAGTSTTAAVDILAERGLFTWPAIAKLSALVYAKTGGNYIHRGRFTISDSLSQWEALKTLFAPGQAATVDVTFPEGLSLRRIAAIIEQHKLCDSSEFVRLATSADFIAGLGLEGESLEGRLMPETYNFYKNTSAQRIIERMVAEHRAFWTPERDSLAEALGYSTDEILTLASIIQAETPLDWEKPRVSGVYHNRLGRGMLLQADPTVQYALGDQQRRLLYRDLEVDSPYNTYKYAGLPPGPINSPGRAAIQAALEPEAHDYLYFVAAGDGTNSHVFSQTVAQHERAVLRYRAARRAHNGG